MPVRCIAVSLISMSCFPRGWGYIDSGLSVSPFAFLFWTVSQEPIVLIKLLFEVQLGIIKSDEFLCGYGSFIVRQSTFIFGMFSQEVQRLEFNITLFDTSLAEDLHIISLFPFDNWNMLHTLSKQSKYVQGKFGEHTLP